ncbi:MAG TPA: 16S rRNA (guanine(966)-N(2))-methyltransferase RsmD [Candidatus Sulfotelmatobacter sp.]|nr:16S rRNA (guanine(966)-N(2))-methyltransferase RsmD [Candidatus Sulfotelmatobacter sp.]
MRISAGEHRGRRLRSPKGRGTRPTSDRVRQALFNILGPRLRDARVLDLFAGTGAVGLESLSRGAASATLVERDASALRSLRENVSALSLGARARILAGEALPAIRSLAEAGQRFDCVFLDPPYGLGLAVRCLEALAPGDIVRDNGVLVVQARHTEALPERAGAFRQTSRRRYGESSLTFYEKESA